MKRNFFFLCCLFLITFISANSKFYVKQEKVQLPGKSLEVRVQGNNNSKVQFHIFKIKKPEQFLISQANIHKIQIENTPIRDDLNKAISLAPNRETRKIYGNISKKAPNDIHFEYCHNNSLLHTIKSNSRGDGYSKVDLGIKKAGVYLVETTMANQITYNIATISNLASIIRREENRILVYAVDRKTGHARSGVDVNIYRGTTFLCSGKTDGKGIFRAQIGYFPKIMVMLRDGDNFTCNDPFFPFSCQKL